MFKHSLILVATSSLLALATTAGCPSEPAKTGKEKKTVAVQADKPADKATKPAAQAAATKPAPAPGDLPAPPDVAAPPADAIKTASGLAYKVQKKGAGKVHPLATDIVQVHYTGWQTNGHMFDSSVKRGQPATFPLNHVISGWTEGVQLMVEGETTRFWIPQELAYKGRSGPPAGMLVFDVELQKIVTPKTPADVAAPPKDSKKTQSGLAYKQITKGEGAKHPTAASVVMVDYSGWTTDGKMFDSSITRGRPATFPLNGVIAGWTEGVQLMVEGETMRFWIPEKLAYQGKPGAPAGMLVFDVTLKKILR